MAGVADGNRAGGGQALGEESLESFFARTPRVALAFSGGCDSSYLLMAAVAAGCAVGAYCVKTAFQADFELEDARRVLDEVRPIAATCASGSSWARCAMRRGATDSRC